MRTAGIEGVRRTKRVRTTRPEEGAAGLFGGEEDRIADIALTPLPS